jgi:hypothetical protein
MFAPIKHRTNPLGGRFKEFGHMAQPSTTNQRSAVPNRRPREAKAQREIIKTWTFDSAGPKKYALQLQKASNGNPCLRIVEGVPQPDGTFRKFDITIWSEDFSSFFQTFEQMKQHIAANNIRTPAGHKYDPSAKPKGGFRGRSAGARQPAAAR